MSFIKINDRHVNLKNVANIVFLEDKVVLNFNYAVSLKMPPKKLISDYVYTSDITEETLDNNEYISENFIKIDNGSLYYVNKSCISSFKKDSRNLKLIFNFNHSVSVDTPNVESSSEFLYIKYVDLNTLNNAYRRIVFDLEEL